MLEVLEKHPGIRCGFHYSGSLLEWLEEEHPDHEERISFLVDQGRVELLTSGYYEPILTVIDRDDARKQIRSYSERLKHIGGKEPRGLWMTERIWEPSVPSLLVDTGVKYVVVDDSHLQSGGLSERELYQPWITEDQGNSVILLGSNSILRYLIPFHGVNEVIDQLKQWSGEGLKLAFYGDDGEKFGLWPGTHRLCYEMGWLDSFFTALEKTGCIELVLPEEAASIGCVDGPVYIPAMSYREMGEWSLPVENREELYDFEKEFKNHSKHDFIKNNLRGGFWRNFLKKYPEANELHKRTADAFSTIKRSGNEEALHHLWRSQCNCSYWHGIFGGIYLPHLRNSVWTELSLGERKAHEDLDDLPAVSVKDINFDGRREIHIITSGISLLLHPERGLTSTEMTWMRDIPVPLGHVLTRRKESYHSELTSVRDQVEKEIRSIHETPRAKEADLSSRLYYDSYRRMSLNEIVLETEESLESVLSGKADIACFQDSDASWIMETTDRKVTVSGVYTLNEFLIAEKEVHVDLAYPVIDIQVRLKSKEKYRFGTELCFNMLTGSEKDRFLRIGNYQPVMLGMPGSGRSDKIVITDMFRGVSVNILLEHEMDIWHYPLETVNLSESGYERVHQGVVVFISKITEDSTEMDYRFSIRIGSA